MRNIIVVFALLAVVFPAALPGQYTRRVRTGTSTANAGPYAGPAATLHGTLKSLTKKEIIIDVDPDQSLTVRLTKKTRFQKDGQPIKPSDIAIGTTVALDAKQDPDLKLSALLVTIAPPGAPGTAPGTAH
jgi:hypothetical protein